MCDDVWGERGGTSTETGRKSRLSATYRFRLLSGDGTHVARGCLWAAERAGELPMNPTAAMGPLIEYGITHGARRIVYPARSEWDYTI